MSDSVTAFSGPVSMQPQSPFLNLPGELRNEIYKILFDSTRLTHGKFRPNKRVKPAANSLALFHTCRRTNEETKDMWLSRVTLNFLSPTLMMEKLKALPRTTLSQIRKVQVYSTQEVWQRRERYTRHYDAPWMLQDLVPDLSLDVLTIVGPKVEMSAVAWWRYTTCWRELRVIQRSTTKVEFYELTRPQNRGAFVAGLALEPFNVKVYQAGDETKSVTDTRTRRVLFSNDMAKSDSQVVEHVPPNSKKELMWVLRRYANGRQDYDYAGIHSFKFEKCDYNLASGVFHNSASGVVDYIYGFENLTAAVSKELPNFDWDDSMPYPADAEKQLAIFFKKAEKAWSYSDQAEGGKEKIVRDCYNDVDDVFWWYRDDE